LSESQGGVRNEVYQEDDESTCEHCKNPYRAFVWVYGAAKIRQSACDNCVYLEEARQAKDKNAKRRLWHIDQGLVLPSMFQNGWAKSNLAFEQEAHMTARAWDFSKNLYIYGTKGTGKTYMARCCLVAAFEAGKQIAEVNAVDFINILRTEHARGVQFLQWPEVILFDDFDKGNWQSWAFAEFYALIGRRYDAGKRTIITTNASLAELVKQLSASGVNRTTVTAAFDRLFPVTVLEVTGKSLRKEIQTDFQNHEEGVNIDRSATNGH